MNTIINSIVWGNGTEIIGDATVSYSCVQGGYAGTGNISFNPIFIAPAAGDFHLTAVDSPCIDAGNPSSQYNDIAFPPSLGTARNDMGAYGGPGAAFRLGARMDDTDQDGLPDSWELKYFGSLNYGPGHDSDGDRLTNAEEFELGTDPSKKDTDGDGYSDYAEVSTHSNPLDPTSVPPPALKIMVESVATEFTAPVGQVNRVMASSNLIDWTLVEEVVGTGDVVRKSYMITNDMRFFRLVKP